MAIFLLLFVAPLAFSEGFYSLGIGVNFFTDIFPEDSYSRKQISTNMNMSYYYFPKDFLLGLYLRASLGGSSLYKEQNARETMRARKSDIFEFRAVASPSLRLQLGSKFQIPFSLGPAFIFSNEKSSERIYISGVYSSGAENKTYSYQSISGGINGDLAFVVIPSKRFFLRPGISFDYIFLRTEKGEMRMNYRTTHNTKYTSVPYSAFNTSIYFELGMRY